MVIVDLWSAVVRPVARRYDQEVRHAPSYQVLHRSEAILFRPGRPKVSTADVDCRGSFLDERVTMSQGS